MQPPWLENPAMEIVQFDSNGVVRRLPQRLESSPRAQPTSAGQTTPANTSHEFGPEAWQRRDLGRDDDDDLASEPRQELAPLGVR
jgi:hypothetical protein